MTLRTADLSDDAPTDGYPFDLLAVRALPIEFSPGATVFVGESGSGKSTLVEAIAVTAGSNPEGGSGHALFETEATHSAMSEHLRLVWRAARRLGSIGVGRLVRVDTTARSDLDAVAAAVMQPDGGPECAASADRDERCRGHVEPKIRPPPHRSSAPDDVHLDGMLLIDATHEFLRAQHPWIQPPDDRLQLDEGDCAEFDDRCGRIVDVDRSRCRLVRPTDAEHDLDIDRALHALDDWRSRHGADHRASRRSSVASEIGLREQHDVGRAQLLADRLGDEPAFGHLDDPVGVGGDDDPVEAEPGRVRPGRDASRLADTAEFHHDLVRRPGRRTHPFEHLPESRR